MAAPPLLADLLNNLPYGIVAYEAVRDGAGQILDYRTVYYNTQALAVLGYTPQQISTELLFQRMPYGRASADLLRGVVDDREITSAPYFNPSLNRWFQIDYRPLGDGFFATFQDFDNLNHTTGERDSSKEPVQQRIDQQLLLKGVFQQSLEPMLIHQAIRDEQGAVVDFQIILLNPAALTITTATEDKLLNQSVCDLDPDFRASGRLAQYIHVLETGEPLNAESVFVSTGKFFNLLVTRIDTDHIVALITDITEAKRDAQLFDGVLDSVTNGLSVLEAVRDETGAVVDWRYVRVSRTVLADTGLTESELMNRTMLELFPGVKQTAYWPAYEAALATGQPQNFEQYYHYDGFDNYTDNWVTRIDGNRIISVYTIINDYKRATLALQKQAERTENVLNGAINGIFLLETDLTDPKQAFMVRSANQASATILGLPVDEMVDRNMDDLFPAYRQLGFHTLYTEAIRTGQLQRAELDYKDENGLVGCYDVSAVKQGDNGIVLTFMDISHQKRQEHKQDQLLVDLRNSNASLERFAYVASHDLQEPLRKIQTFGNLVVNRYGVELPDEGRDMLQRMQTAASRMSTLIQDLLAYSQLSTQNEAFEPVDLTAVVAGIQSDLELVIAEKQAQLTVPHLPTIRGNAGQLRQLFQNLLTNALKFMKPDVPPQVTLSVRIVSADDVPDRVPNRQRRSWVAVDVADNGIGFDKMHQERIFQLFERLHGRTEYAGTGIGLAVCLKVAENHGGTITARSQPGQGATFTIYLPV